MLKYASDFAMTPASRSRIHVPMPAKKSREQLAEERFFPDPA
jgi:hypothetical protein